MRHSILLQWVCDQSEEAITLLDELHCRMDDPEPLKGKEAI